MSSQLTEENKKQDISDQDESFEKNGNEFLENKRKRTRLQYKNNNEDDDNVDIGCILNIPDFISKINNNEPNTISNSNMILFMLELCINSSQFNLTGDNSSRKFWEEVGKIKDISPITKIFKPETLRKYWRLLRNIKKPKKIINILTENQNLINKFLDKAKRARKPQDMTSDEQIEEIISEFERAFPKKKKATIVEKLYQNNFDIKNTYLVLKDEKNFGYLAFNEKEDELILNKNLSYDDYRQLALKKGHINIIKRKNFLEGKYVNK